MKRRSMLGRRHSRLLQSPPAAPSSTFRRPQLSSLRNPQRTPEQSSRPDDNPFRTPSVNGSLSEVANEDPWSVFKCVKNGLKSPFMESTDHSVFRNPQEDIHKRESALKNNYNRKKEQKLAEKLGSITSSASTKIRTFEFPIYKHQRDAINFPESSGSNRTPAGSNSGDGTETRFNGVSSNPIKPFEFSVYKHQRRDDKKTVEPKTDGEPASTRPAVREHSTEKRKHSEYGSQSSWECQDIRNLSPPWSNNVLNPLSEFNMQTPRPPSRATSSPAVNGSSPLDLCNSLAYPLEVTVMENTMVQAKVTPQAKETAPSEDNKNEKLDLKSALSEVSLGVNSLELLDKHGLGGWSTTSWASRAPLQKLPEEPGELEVLDKENLHIDHHNGVVMEEEHSQYSDDTFLSPSQGSSSTSKTSGKDMKKHLERLVDVNSRIEEAEEQRDSAEEKIRQLEESIRSAIEERRAAEEKRRKLENERKMLNYELLEEMSQAPSIFGLQAPKRRKLGPPSAKKESSKKGPSFVASKLLKRDFARTPVRTPRRFLADSTLSMNSILNPFTPKTLRKNINDQYDQIFGK